MTDTIAKGTYTRTPLRVLRCRSSEVWAKGAAGLGRKFLLSVGGEGARAVSLILTGPNYRAGVAATEIPHAWARKWYKVAHPANDHGLHSIA